MGSYFKSTEQTLDQMIFHVTAVLPRKLPDPLKSTSSESGITIVTIKFRACFLWRKVSYFPFDLEMLGDLLLPASAGCQKNRFSRKLNI